MSTSSQHTDAELLRRSRRDPDAFVEICRRHAADLGAYLAKELRDDGLGRELLAETLAEAWFCRRRFRDPGDGSARPWLYGIARNLTRRSVRDRAIEARARSRLGLPVTPTDGVAELLERIAAEQALGSLEERLGELPEEQRRALELRVIDGLAYGEIAAELEITPEGARTRVFRALATLRLHLGRST